MDIVDKQTRSRMMAGIRSKDTRPELSVRRFLHRQGFRYRLHSSHLPGRPDLVLPKHRVAILVHGCFWHRHRECAFSTTPASNQEQWGRKFAANVERDGRNLAALEDAGWRVIIIWECGLKRKNVESNLAWLPAAISQSDEKRIEWPKAGSAFFSSAVA